MNRKRILLIVPVSLIAALAAVSMRSRDSCAQPPDRLIQQREMAAEVNHARTHPSAYAEIIEQYFAGLRDDRVLRNGERLIRMDEGRPAVDEAIGFLRSVEALPPLTLNSCLSQAAPRQPGWARTVGARFETSWEARVLRREHQLRQGYSARARNCAAGG